ncbi:hypothetical protein EIP91_004262 [Steccherinum ochraceum]|uniref:Uncharacterized protein n=1 Tax=Steccherinum ochraceum TaxID=92696 RepID=A0A4R0RFC2_9APHY|nr:hypothetical protein EIP91_004262 [Steccherinum ochraceum]
MAQAPLNTQRLTNDDLYTFVGVPIANNRTYKFPREPYPRDIMGKQDGVSYASLCEGFYHWLPHDAAKLLSEALDSLAALLVRTKHGEVLAATAGLQFKPGNGPAARARASWNPAAAVPRGQVPPTFVIQIVGNGSDASFQTVLRSIWQQLSKMALLAKQDSFSGNLAPDLHPMMEILKIIIGNGRRKLFARMDKHAALFQIIANQAVTNGNGRVASVLQFKQLIEAIDAASKSIDMGVTITASGCKNLWRSLERIQSIIDQLSADKSRTQNLKEVLIVSRRKNYAGDRKTDLKSATYEIE